MPEPRVLVVDDQREMAEMLADGLTDRGYRAVAVTSGREALARLEAESFDALVTDLRMQGMDGLDLLGRSLALDADRPVILMTAYGAIDGAIDAIRRGAYHYLAKPFKLDELVLFLERALAGVRVRREAATLRRELAGRSAPAGMLGRSKPMRVVFDIVERVADAPASVLITGETGTGKGVVAAALHARSGRARAPFVTVNCAALPEPLLESELFGHVKGAFTGATANRTGLFVDADGGTLFLDEIGDMAISLQAKLLRAIESGKVRAVGEGRERSVDVRIIAATHHDLRAAAAKGAFREDLLYRLDVVTIELPALRRAPRRHPRAGPALHRPGQGGLSTLTRPRGRPRRHGPPPRLPLAEPMRARSWPTSSSARSASAATRRSPSPICRRSSARFAPARRPSARSCRCASCSDATPPGSSARSTASAPAPPPSPTTTSRPW